MPSTDQREKVEDVTGWLQQAAERRNLNGKFKATYFRTDGKWLHYAVSLGEGADSFEKAKVLQELEDEWDAHKPHSEWRLLLVPSN